ncbi:MAG: putative major facilitator superfamily transporter, partial [Candidatus Krumholzibacteriota bacterium]|nr:putative major facilitator superfamily transporter [Candidatus Krumholzibacteriota bacterium]
RFFFALTFSTLQTIFALYAERRFGFDSRNTGYVLAYTGVLTVLVQGLVIGWLTDRVKDSILITAATGLLALSFVGWAIVPNVRLLLLVFVPIAVSGGVLNTVPNSALSKAVSPAEIGGTLGLSASLESLSRVLAPSGGGYVLEKLGTWAPGAFGAGILFLLTGFVFRTICCRERRLERGAAGPGRRAG